MSFTLRSQMARFSRFPWLNTQKIGWISLGFCFSQFLNSFALHSEPATSRPLPYYSVLLFLIISFRAPSGVNLKSTLRIATSSMRRARKSYPSKRRVRLRMSAIVSGWAAIILMRKSWLMLTAFFVQDTSNAQVAVLRGKHPRYTSDPQIQVIC